MLLPDKAIKVLANAEPYHKTKPVNGYDDIVETVDIINPYVSEIGVFSTMINPFVDRIEREVTAQVEGDMVVSVPSYGLSSYGYDVRLSDHIEVFSNLHGAVIDPLEHNDDNLIAVNIKIDELGRRYFMLPPSCYMLGYTREYFCIPKDVTALVTGKSTYARCGVEVNTTVIEAGFCGNVVIEASNASSLPVKIYLDGGFAQFLFIKGYDKCEVDYSMGDRKYQCQTGMTYAK